MLQEGKLFAELEMKLIELCKIVEMNFSCSLFVEISERFSNFQVKFSSQFSSDLTLKTKSST